MKRNALLIGNSGGLEGIGIDIDRTSKFLKSSLGGQWRDSEITKLFDPSKKQVNEVLAHMRSERADYTFFLFTGHGCHYGQTELSLNNHEKLLESELNSIGDRQLSIFDCCRVESNRAVLSLEVMKSLAFDSVDTTRQRYESRIMQAAKQHTKLYSCSVGEASYDTPEGAIYLSHLLDAARVIPQGAQYLTIEDAHSSARAKTIQSAARNGNKQTPAAYQAKLPHDMQLILSIK